MGMPCRDGCRSTGGPFSVPLGYGGDVRSVRGWSWPRLNPGDVAPQPSAEIDRRRMQGQLGKGRKGDIVLFACRPAPRRQEWLLCLARRALRKLVSATTSLTGATLG